MFFHGADKETDMQESPAEKSRNGGDSGGGDGLHHHEIHEDEGGGFRSMHTHPDGTKESGDHVTYEEAKADMDSKFGKDDMSDDSEDGGDGGDMSPDDIAGSYGRKASCD